MADLREKFERWAQDRGHDTHRSSGDGYLVYSVQIMWMAWQASPGAATREGFMRLVPNTATGPHGAIAPTTEPTAKPITGLTEEEIRKAVRPLYWDDRAADMAFDMDLEIAQAITRALAEKNGLAVQGED